MHIMDDLNDLKISNIDDVSLDHLNRVCDHDESVDYYYSKEYIDLSNKRNKYYKQMLTEYKQIIANNASNASNCECMKTYLKRINNNYSPHCNFITGIISGLSLCDCINYMEVHICNNEHKHKKTSDFITLQTLKLLSSLRWTYLCSVGGTLKKARDIFGNQNNFFNAIIKNNHNNFIVNTDEMKVFNTDYLSTSDEYYELSCTSEINECRSNAFKFDDKIIRNMVNELCSDDFDCKNFGKNIVHCISDKLSKNNLNVTISFDIVDPSWNIMSYKITIPLINSCEYDDTLPIHVHIMEGWCQVA